MALTTPHRLQDETPTLGAGPEVPHSQPPHPPRISLWGSARFLVAFAGFGLDVIWQMTRSSIRRALKRRPIIKRVERESTAAAPKRSEPAASPR